MNRDAILATVIGFAIGLIITGLFLIGPNLKNILSSSFNLPTLSFLKPKGSSPQLSPTPTPQVSTVVIDSPLPDAVVDNESLLVSGRTMPNETVILQNDLEDQAIIASADGTFAGKMKLKEGKNDITASSYGTGGQQTAVTVTVFYTSEEL